MISGVTIDLINESIYIPTIQPDRSDWKMIN